MASNEAATVLAEVDALTPVARAAKLAHRQPHRLILGYPAFRDYFLPDHPAETETRRLATATFIKAVLSTLSEGTLNWGAHRLANIDIENRADACTPPHHCVTHDN